MSLILLLDKKLFHFFNQIMSSPLIDPFMVFISSKGLALTVILAFFTYSSVKRDWRLFTVLCFLLLAVGVADFSAYNFVKPLFARIRPCHLASEVVRTIDGCGGKYSFPSNHAVNLATTTFFVVRYFGWRWGWYVMAVALLVGISRIYLGVHYPLDIAFGFIYGALIGWCVFKFGRWFMDYFFPKSVINQNLQGSPKGK